MPQILSYVVDCLQWPLAEQVQAVRDYTAKLAAEREGYEVVEPIIETALTNPKMRCRPGGKRLFKAQEGDVIVFPRLGMHFRSQPNLIASLEQWLKQRVEVHVVREGLVFTDSLEEAKHPKYRRLLASAVGSELTAKMEARGRSTRAPRAWERAVGPKGNRIYRVVALKWAACATVYIARKRGLSWAETSDYVENALAHALQREPIPRKQQKRREYSVNRCLSIVRRIGIIAERDHEFRKHLEAAISSDIPLDDAHRYVPPPLDAPARPAAAG
jgi:hypothetical protein